MSNSLWPHGLQPPTLFYPWRFSRQEYWSGLPCPPPGDLLNPGAELRSPTWQGGSLPTEPPGSPRRLDWITYLFSRGSSPPRDRTHTSCIGRWILCHWATWEIPDFTMHVCLLSGFSHIRFCASLWTVACQAPLSMGFSRQEYWSGLPCPPPGDLPNSGIKPASLMSPALVGGLFTTSTTGKTHFCLFHHWNSKHKRIFHVSFTS